MNLTEVNKILKENNLSAKKGYGQNFLVNDNITEKIVNALASISQNVIEIGPGLGSLTRIMNEHNYRVLCYEIDEDMVNILEKTFLNNSNIYIKHADFLKSNVEKDIIDNDLTNPVIIANLPYYITTPILLKILEEVPTVKQMVLMMQKEVAERLLGKPSTKDYNALSVLVQYFTKVERVINVPKTAFYPVPAVDSTVIKLTYKEEILTKAINTDFFLKFNRAIFKQRRKTLANNISASFNLSKNDVQNILIKEGHNPQIRAENLTVDEIVLLSNVFFKQ